MTLLLIIGIILFVLWLLGLLTRRTLGGLIHIAVVIAIIRNCSGSLGYERAGRRGSPATALLSPERADIPCLRSVAM